MSKIIIYIATSLDGYIARKNGKLDRLTDHDNPDNVDYGYDDLVKNVDTIIMGKNTYAAIIKSTEVWPYKGYNTYVLSRNPDLDITTPDTHMLTGLPPEKIKKLCDKADKNVWIMGGGDVVSQCVDLEIVDEMILTIVPIVLGGGVRLFPGMINECHFSLEKSEAFSTGFVNLHYKRIPTVI